MRHRAVFWAALLLTAPFTGAHAQKCTLGHATSLPFTQLGPQPVVQIAINDVPGRFIVDTGSADTILFSDYADRSHVGRDTRESSGRDSGRAYFSGIGGKGTLPLVMVHARNTQVGELRFQDWEFWAEQTPQSKATPFDGLLGRDFLHYFDIELDFKSMQMTLWQIKGCKSLHPTWSGDYDDIPLTKHGHGEVSVPVMIDDQFLNLMLDTGAGNIVLTHKGGLAAGATDAQLTQDAASNGYGIGGRDSMVKHKFKIFLIGSQESHNPVIRVEAAPDLSTNGISAMQSANLDGYVSIDKFKADRVWISFSTDSLFTQTTQQAQAKK